MFPQSLLYFNFLLSAFKQEELYYTFYFEKKKKKALSKCPDTFFCFFLNKRITIYTLKYSIIWSNTTVPCVNERLKVKIVNTRKNDLFVIFVCSPLSPGSINYPTEAYKKDAKSLCIVSVSLYCLAPSLAEEVPFNFPLPPILFLFYTIG